jgi:histidinol-phosphate aminotransferase
LSEAALRASRARIDEVVRQRDSLARALRAQAAVRDVHPSEGNYLLVRFHEVATAYDRLLAQGVVVRDVRALVPDALRITVGSAQDNARLLAALGAAP